ncbi:hypothetical protein [Streptomyces sp. NPDC048142]|uniref:hypothetical protein n=1 Tax=Streptomyces sp. NPDC048142 TaxID=3365501 RepID=UPI00372469E8
MKANLPARRARGHLAARAPAPLAASVSAESERVRQKAAERPDEVEGRGDTVVVGIEGAPPDRAVTARADSRRTAGVKTVPRVARTERG